MPGKHRNALINATNSVLPRSDMIVTCVDLIAAQIMLKTVLKLCNCIHFLMSADELMDIASIVQLMCFVCCVNNHRNLDNSFLTVLPLSDATIERVIYIGITNFLIASNIDIY